MAQGRFAVASDPGQQTAFPLPHVVAPDYQAEMEGELRIELTDAGYTVRQSSEAVHAFRAYAALTREWNRQHHRALEAELSGDGFRAKAYELLVEARKTGAKIKDPRILDREAIVKMRAAAAHKHDKVTKKIVGNWFVMAAAVLLKAFLLVPLADKYLRTVLPDADAVRGIASIGLAAVLAYTLTFVARYLVQIGVGMHAPEEGPKRRSVADILSKKANRAMFWIVGTLFALVIGLFLVFDFVNAGENRVGTVGLSVLFLAILLVFEMFLAYKLAVLQDEQPESLDSVDERYPRRSEPRGRRDGPRQAADPGDQRRGELEPVSDRARFGRAGPQAPTPAQGPRRPAQHDGHGGGSGAGAGPSERKGGRSRRPRDSRPMIGDPYAKIGAAGVLIVALWGVGVAVDRLGGSRLLAQGSREGALAPETPFEVSTVQADRKEKHTALVALSAPHVTVIDPGSVQVTSDGLRLDGAQIRPVYEYVQPKDPKPRTVLLLLDNSTSMVGIPNAVPATDPQYRRLDACRNLIESLPPTDKVSLACFPCRRSVEDQRRMNPPERPFELLTPPAAAMKAGDLLDALRDEENGPTPLYRAVEEGAARLAKSPPGVQRVLVLLTDGQDSNHNPAELRDAAAAVKADGIEMYAVGLGAEPDMGVLKTMAQHTLRADDATVLSRAFRQIALAMSRTVTQVDMDVTVARDGRPIPPGRPVDVTFRSNGKLFHIRGKTQ